MADQPHDVAYYGYGFASSFGEPVEPVGWHLCLGLPETVIKYARFEDEPLIRAFFRLRNGQIIRVRPRRSLPATARCE